MYYSIERADVCAELGERAKKNLIEWLNKKA